MEQQNVPTTEELAAAIAAIGLLLEQQQLRQPEPRAGWSASARLMVQRMPPRRVRELKPSWSTAERLRRSMRDGFTGVTGL